MSQASAPACGRPSGKDVSLEAARGLAAISVVAWHATLGFFPARAGIFPNFDPSLSFNTSVWFGLINGTAAVAFFFVLSGFVLTRAALLNGEPGRLLGNALKRWPRLALPVVLAALLSWVLFSTGGYRFVEAGALTGSPWLSHFAYAFDQPFPVSFPGAMLQGLFFTFFRGDASYDSSLWTMRYEFTGSFLSFGMALLLLQVRQRWAGVYLIAIALILCHFSDIHFSAFFIGTGIAYLLPRERLRLPVWAILALVLAAVYLAGDTGVRTGAFLPLHYVARAIDPLYVNMLGSALLIIALGGVDVFRSGPPEHVGRWLGKLSFPLYLVHVPVLCSGGSWALVATAQSYPSPAPEIAAVTVTVYGSLLAAIPLAWVNEAWIGWLNGVAGKAFPAPPAVAMRRAIGQDGARI